MPARYIDRAVLDVKLSTAILNSIIASSPHQVLRCLPPCGVYLEEMFWIGTCMYVLLKLSFLLGTLSLDLSCLN